MQVNRYILDFLEWINSLLWRKQQHAKVLPYTRIQTWSGLEGYLHLVERSTKPNEPKAIATFLFRRKRFNGYRATAGPTDVYLDLKRSRITGHSHMLTIVEAEPRVREDGFKALPLHYGEYMWLSKLRSTKRRRELVSKLPTLNQWEERDRVALLITFAVAYRLTLSPTLPDWNSAIAAEERLVMTADRTGADGTKLKDGKVSGVIIDKKPKGWE